MLRRHAIQQFHASASDRKQDTCRVEGRRPKRHGLRFNSRSSGENRRQHMHLDPVSHARARQGTARSIDASCLDGWTNQADRSRIAVSLQCGPCGRQWLAPGTDCPLHDLLQFIPHSLRRPVMTSTAASSVSRVSDSTRPVRETVHRRVREDAAMSLSGVRH
jgi:hypothetical protein